MVTVNLIPMRRRRQRVSRALRRAWAVGAISYAAALVVAYACWRTAWNADGVDESRPLTLVRGDVAESEKAVANVRASLNEVTLALRANRAVTRYPDWSVLLALVARIRGDDLVLDRCGVDGGARPVDPATGQKSIEPAPPVLRLQGHGRTQAAVSQFVLALERTGLFETVSILKANREPFLSGEGMSFRLECRFESGPLEDHPSKSKATRPPRGRDVAGLGAEGAL